MGVSVFLLSAFYCAKWPSSPIADSHQVLQRAGLETASDRSPEMVEYRLTNSSISDTAYGSLGEFTETVESTGSGVIHYQYDSEEIHVTFRSGPEIGDHPMPVGLGGPNAKWLDPDESGSEAVERRIDMLYDVFVGLGSALDPDVGYLMLFNDHSAAEPVPESHIPSEHGMESLPFLLLLNDSWIGYCGGRSHVLETPVYELQTLDTGSIVLRIKEQISLDGCNYMTGYDHLFDSG